MNDFLIFTLECRMASFGDLAGHERRGSEIWPGRSALIGLLGGAMGIRRDDVEGQRQLRELSFAVAAFDTGTPLRDYHTVESVHQKVKRPGTRALALSKGFTSNALNTTITLRDYRCGVMYGVSVWSKKVKLDALSKALVEPVFVPYLGRKSCPLSAPMAPRVVESSDPISAIDKITIPPWRLGESNLNQPKRHFVASDPHPRLKPSSIEWRHDEPVNRQTWHFKTRPVHMVREETR